MAKNSIKVAKKQLKSESKQQGKQLKLQQLKNDLANSKIRQEAIQTGRPIPFGAQDKATAFHSTEDQPVSIKTKTPEQENVLNNLYQSLPQGIQNLNMPGGQSNFAPIANEARRNFSQRSLPGLAERFAGLGNDRLDSGSFQQAREGAIGDFESQLAAAQAQHGLQEQSLQSNNLFNSLGAFLNPQFDYQVVPGQNSGARNVWNGAKELAYDAALGYLNPAAGLSSLGKRALGQRGQQGGGNLSNGTGAGNNSSGFSGVQNPAWQPQQNQLSTQNLAGTGYGLPDMGNPGAFNLR